MHRVLVVCHGNINRSAACAAVLRAVGIEVRSAGFVNPGHRASKKMRDVMAAVGYDLEEHRSTLLTQELVDWADVVVFMDRGNRKRLEPFDLEAVELHCLGSFAEPKVERIPDPAFMARGSEEFAATVALIMKASSNLAKEYRSD